MAVPASRTWTISPNNTFTNTIADDQYREAVFDFKDTCINGGWTVNRSSNGTVVSDTDNWSSSTDIAFGTSGNGSWIVMQSPSGWLTNSGTVEMLFYVNDTSGTPQQAEIKFSTFGYRNGNLTTLPTANGEETTVNTGGRNIIPWSGDGTTGRWTSWYSSRGDVMFAVKEQGTTNTTPIRHCFAVFSNTDADGGGDGDQRWFFFSRSSTGNIFDSGGHLTSSSWRAVMPSGAVAGTVEAATILSAVSTWTNGEDFEGDTASARIVVWNDTAIEGRDYGRWVDVFAAPGNSEVTNYNDDDDSEGAQDPRRVIVGEVWLYMPASAFPNPFA